jgi:hypothetical protein
LHVDPSGSIACHGAGPTISIPAGTKGTIGLRYLPKSGARDQLDLPMQVTPGAITLLMPGSVAALLRNVTLPMTVTVYPGS